MEYFCKLKFFSYSNFIIVKIDKIALFLILKKIYIYTYISSNYFFYFEYHLRSILIKFDYTFTSYSIFNCVLIQCYKMEFKIK